MPVILLLLTTLPVLMMAEPIYLVLTGFRYLLPVNIHRSTVLCYETASRCQCRLSRVQMCPRRCSCVLVETLCFSGKHLLFRSVCSCQEFNFRHYRSSAFRFLWINVLLSATALSSSRQPLSGTSFLKTSDPPRRCLFLDAG